METKLKIEKQDLNASPITEEHSLFFGKVFRGKSAYQYAVDSGLFSGTEEEFAQYLGNIHNVTEDANEATAAAIVATEGATQATMEAREAKEAADSATARATQATAGATTATENAIQATANTNEAIARAEQATKGATNATNEAKAATNNANTAAERAKEEVDKLNAKADTEGYYPNMTVGKADGVVGVNAVQEALTLTTKPNGNIVIGNIAGQSKEFMPATPSGDPMHYAYVDAGAVWNANTGYWEMYDMKDITNEEMRKAYNLGNFNPSDGSPLYASTSSAVSWVRFNLPRTGTYSLYITSANSFASTNSKIEFINLCPFINIETACQMVNMQNAFYQCASLRKIFGIIEMSFTTNTTDTFKGCSALVAVTIKNLKQSLSFADSPLLSKESLLYIINDCASNATFTITLHPDVYVKCTDDINGEWYDDVETAIDMVYSNKTTTITLASA